MASPVEQTVKPKLNKSAPTSAVTIYSSDSTLASILKQDRILSEGPTRHPPQHFLYLRETTSWWCEGEGEEKVHLLTHTTTRGVGKNS